MGRIIEAFKQFFDSAGDPLDDGYLLFLESQSNNTKKATYFDANYQIPNANPLQLSAEGRAPDIFGTGDYKVILYDGDPEDLINPGSMLQTFDPVTAQGTITSTGGGSSFDVWNTTTTYNLGDIVTHNLMYYRSLVSLNLNLNPAVETASWEQIEFVPEYNAAVTYEEGDYVHYGYNLYLSKTALNMNHQPDSSPVYWRRIASGIIASAIKTDNYEILPTELDNLFILGSATTANKQFDLPAMDATTDRFVVTIYNESNYNLTLAALGGSAIWLEDPVLTKGALVQLFYDYGVDTWLPLGGNLGPALGSQILGTPTTPVTAAYIGVLHTTQVPDDEYILFGSDNDARILYNSTGNVLDLLLNAGLSFNIYVNSVLHWQFASTGELLAGASNPLPYIGNVSNPISRIYVTDTYIPDAGRIYWGDGTDYSAYYDGSIFRLVGNGAFYLGTLDATEVTIFVNNTAVGYFDTSLNFTIAGSITMNGGQAVFNAAQDMVIQHTGSAGYIDNYVGNLVFRTGATPTTAMYFDTGQAAWFQDDVHINGFTYIGSGQINGTMTINGTLNDGTNLNATFAEIDARCDAIPDRDSVTNTSTVTVGTSGTLCTLDLGTVTDGDFAIVDIRSTVKKITNDGYSYIEFDKLSGTGNFALGGFSGGALKQSLYGDISLMSIALDISACSTLEVTASGTLVVDLLGRGTNSSTEFSSSNITVTWIKKQ